MSMFEELPSLRGFQPKFYSGDSMRFHLPLLYDLMSAAEPKRVVVLGFGNGDAFFALCQAATERRIDCNCIAVRRDRAGDSEEADAAWNDGKDYGEEFYGTRAHFFANRAAALKAITEGSVDILLIDDSDSGKEVAADLSSWKAKLSPDAIVLVHGLRLDRDDSPGNAWSGWVGQRSHATFSEGVGLGIALLGENQAGSFFLKHSNDLAVLYSVAAARIDASARAANADKETAAFATRQVWLDSLLTDRRKVQTIMDHQAHEIAFLEQALKEQRHHFDNLRRDRAKARVVKMPFYTRPK